MISTDEYIKSIELKKTGSKLLNFKADILDLRRSGLTYQQIKDFLKINGVSVSIPGLQKFCLKHLNNDVQTKNNKIEPAKLAVPKTVSKPLFEKKKITESKKIESDYEPPAWAEKDLNPKDLI